MFVLSTARTLILIGRTLMLVGWALMFVMTTSVF